MFDKHRTQSYLQQLPQKLSWHHRLIQQAHEHVGLWQRVSHTSNNALIKLVCIFVRVCEAYRKIEDVVTKTRYSVIDLQRMRKSCGSLAR